MGLAKEVLKEIPKQMIAYMNKMKIKPNDATPEVRAAQMAQMLSNQSDAYFDQQKEQFIAKAA